MRKGWTETRLPELVENLDRFRQPISAIERETRLGNVPYYGANGRTGFIDEYIFNETLVLLGEDAIDFLNPLAKKAYMISGPSWVNNHAHVLRAIKTKVDSFFLTEALNAVDYSQYVSFGTRSKLTQASMNGIKLLIPPLPEQKRIVDLISSVDSYIDALEQQVESARKSRSAVLHEMLSAGGESWTETTLGEVALFSSVRVQPDELRPDSKYVGLEHLQPYNLNITDAGLCSEVKSLVTPFNISDVLFGRLRPYLHKVAFADFAGYCSPEILVLTARDNCHSKFLAYICDLESTIQFCVDKSAGTKMPRTSQRDLSALKLSLPSIPEQERIVDLISSMDEGISATERLVSETKQLRSGLLSDLLSGKHEIPEVYDKVMGAA
jgi:type I restriction enzyme S subunit